MPKLYKWGYKHFFEVSETKRY